MGPFMDEDKIDLAAHFIARGRLGPSLIPRPPDDLIPKNVFDGYAVQALSLIHISEPTRP